MGEDSFNDLVESSEPDRGDLGYYQQVFLEGRTIVLDPELPEQWPLPARSEDCFKALVRSPLILDRVPPYNGDAERAVLGIYLVHPKRRGKHDKGLSDCFYFDHYRKLHMAMTLMRHLDLNLLEHELQISGDLESVGGAAELVKLHRIGEKTNPKHLLDYVEIITEHALRRGLIMVSSQGLRAGYDFAPNVYEEIDRMIKDLKDLRRSKFKYYGNL